MNIDTSPNEARGAEMDEFAVYHVEPMIDLGMPLLLTAVTMSTDKIWIGEIHLLLQDLNCTVIESIITADEKMWPDCEIRLDKEFIEEQLLQRASVMLTLHLQDHGFFDRYGGFLQVPQFSKTSNNALYAFWAQHKCGDKFSTIKERTKSLALAGLLGIIVTLPKFRFEPGPYPVDA
jgi:hypothetical protein